MVETMQDIIDGNETAGFFFFSPDTMKWFKSKVYDEVFPVKDGALFVTSEKQGGNPRLYTVRKYHAEDGDISTVDGFQAYASLSGALKGAARAALDIDSES